MTWKKGRTIFQEQIIDPTELKGAIRQKRQERARERGKYLCNYQLWSMFLRAGWKDRLLSFNASQHRNHSRPPPSLDVPLASLCVGVCAWMCACVCMSTCASTCSRLSTSYNTKHLNTGNESVTTGLSTYRGNNCRFGQQGHFHSPCMDGISAQTEEMSQTFLIVNSTGEKMQLELCPENVYNMYESVWWILEF